MSYIGYRDLQYTSEEESRHFEAACRLSGHWMNVVRDVYPLEAYDSIQGSNWNKPSPNPAWKTTGLWGMSLRYATIDATYRQTAIEREKHSDEEIDEFAAAWQGKLDRKLPLPDQEILKIWRANRPDPDKKKAQREYQRKHRRTKKFESKFLSSRNAEVVYKRFKSGFATLSALDEEVLRQIATLLAQANDQLFQAEQMRGDWDIVPEDHIAHYQKMMDLSVKYQKQALDMMKGHGLDYGTRRRQREAQTAANILDDFVAQGEALFDQRATEMICPECELSLGYVLRHFTTIRYRLIASECPRCEKGIVQVEMDAEADEVMGDE